MIINLRIIIENEEGTEGTAGAGSIYRGGIGCA
jgi:hypothetical protein